MIKIRGISICLVLILITLGMVFAADLAGENLPSTCDGSLCKPNPNYDANKPTNAGKVMGFEKADYVTLEKGDGAIIEKETREIEINKEQKVTIKGVEYNLPSKAKIKFVKENNVEKTIITLPDGTTVTDPKVVDKEMAKDAVFEIKAESGKLKLGKDSLEGKLSFETDKDGNLHKFLEGEKCNLGGLALTQKKGEKTEIFSDGELHPDAKGAYLSVGDKSVAIGKNTEGKGPEVKFEPGNRFLNKITTEQNVVMSAGRDADKKNSAAAGTIKITNGGEGAPEVAVDKSFSIENGKFEINTGKTSKGKEGFLTKVDERLGKSYAIEITNEKGFVNSAGNKYKYVMDSNNQMEVAALEREPIKFNTDLKESGREVLISWEKLSPLLSRVNLGGKAEIPTVTSDENKNQVVQLSFEAKASIRANEVINKWRGRDLGWDENLAKGSYEWSKYMAESLGDLQHADIRSINVGGENIAMFTSNTPLSSEAVGEHLANQWITSKTGHKENILTPWRVTGIGVYVKRSARYGYEYYATERFNR